MTSGVDPEIIARYKARKAREDDEFRQRFANHDTPEQRAQVATGLRNLYAWMGLAARPYAGPWPWPTPAELQSDDWYANFLTRPDVIDGLAYRKIAQENPQ